MVNRAYPTDIEQGLGDPLAARRIWGLRANASALSHAELAEAEELDERDPVALGRDNAELREPLPNVHLFGGCCGTDSRHVAEIVGSW